jgi:hypothetical protein
MPESDIPLTTLDRDSVVGKRIGKSKQTLKRWDENPKLRELGWPPPVILNGVRHRDRARVDRFLENCARLGMSAA